MPTTERLRDRGARRGQRTLVILADEFRNKRLAVELSQAQVAQAAGISRPTYSRVETVRFAQLPIVAASQVAAVLGLDLAIRVFPGPDPMRDAAHAARLGRVLAHVSAPLTYRTEVPLPQSADRPYEQRGGTHSYRARAVAHGSRDGDAPPKRSGSAAPYRAEAAGRSGRQHGAAIGRHAHEPTGSEGQPRPVPRLPKTDVS